MLSSLMGDAKRERRRRREENKGCRREIGMTEEREKNEEEISHMRNFT